MFSMNLSQRSCVFIFVICLALSCSLTECTSVGEGQNDGTRQNSVPEYQKVIIMLQEIEKDIARPEIQSSFNNPKQIFRNASRDSNIIHISQTTGFNSVVSVNRDGLVNYTQSRVGSRAPRIKRQNVYSIDLRFPDLKTIKKYVEIIPDFYENFLKSLRLLPFLSIVLDKKLGRLTGSSPMRRIARNRQLDENYEEKEYCYGEIGCVTINKEFYHPILRPLNVPPEDRRTVNTNYYFFSRRQLSPVKISPQNLKAFADVDFDSSRPTKVVVHGWVSTASTEWVPDLARALLKHGDYNVVTVDWGGGANLFYSFVVPNTLVVALELAHLLRWLQSNAGLSLPSVHLIGMSLGAHICGYVGQWNPGVGRITGLDPARPYFQGLPEAVRLDPSDAAFVDVIHTDTNPDPFAGSPAAGTGELSGHLDFFPNGGHSQPDCDVLSPLTTGTACSHSFAYVLFIASIRSPCPFLAFPCKNYHDFQLGKCFSCDGPLGCARMGIDADSWRPMGRSKVAMYLSTTGQPDYCQRHFRFVLHLSNGQTPGAYALGDLDLVLKNGRGQRKLFRLTSSGAVKLKLGTSPSFLLRHGRDHSSSNVALLRWREKSPIFKRCPGTCVSSLTVSHVTLTALDGDGALVGNRTSVVMCGRSRATTIRSGQTARFQTSPSCSESQK